MNQFKAIKKFLNEIMDDLKGMSKSEKTRITDQRIDYVSDGMQLWHTCQMLDLEKTKHVFYGNVDLYITFEKKGRFDDVPKAVMTNLIRIAKEKFK